MLTLSSLSCASTVKQELLLLLPDLTEAQMMSSLTADQLAELCADTAAVAQMMVSSWWCRVHG